MVEEGTTTNKQTYSFAKTPLKAAQAPEAIARPIHPFCPTNLISPVSSMVGFPVRQLLGSDFVVRVRFSRHVPLYLQ